MHCVSKEFWYRKFSSKGGGKLHGFVEIFFYLTGPKKTSPGKHSVFQKISGREKHFMDKRGGYLDFPSKSFCRTVPKYFIGEHFGVSEKFLYRNFSCIGGGGASRFCRNFLSLRTETKSFVKEPFCFQKISGIEKKLWIRGGISRFSVEIFVSHSAKKFRKGILLFLRKFLVSKSFMDEKGGGVSRFSVENFWSHSAEKLRWGTL